MNADDLCVCLFFFAFVFLAIGGLLMEFAVVFAVGSVIALMGAAMFMAVPIIQIATSRR